MFGISKKKKKGKAKSESSKTDSKAKAPADSKKKDKGTAIDDESKVKRSEQIKICIGVLLLVFVIIMVVSFISYFFTWKSDQSLSNYGFFQALFSSDVHVDNKAGKLGALIANFFICNTFGIASFAIVAILVVISFKLLKIRKAPLLPFIIRSSVIMIWLSIALASIFRKKFFMVGGWHGYSIFTSLCDLVGAVGAYSIIIVLALFIAIFCFENSIIGINKLLKRISEIKIKDLKSKLKNSDDEISTEEVRDVNVILPIENAATDSVPVSDNEDSEKDEAANTIELEHTGDVKSTKKFDSSAGLDLEINTGNNEPQDGQQGVDIIQDEEINLQGAEKNEDVQLDIAKASEEQQVDTNDWAQLPDYDPTKDLEFYKFPPVDLLPDFQPKGKLSDEDLKKQLNENKDRIVKTLGDYNIQISKISATVGPTVTLYEIVPAPGVKISKIKNLEDDIALSLAALGIRIIAPIPGKGTIGIEVPNPNPETVSMRSVIRSQKFQDSKYDLPVALGKTITNETYVFNLAKTPHLLVAGATGQGKSVGVNAIIASLLYKKHPSQLKFVLVDPKMVELSIYKAIEKHYLAKLPGNNPSIITDVSKVTEAMNSLCILMDERYELLMKAGCRNINEYNEKFIKRKLNPEKGHYYMFYIVVVIDEFADIIVQEGKQVETPISRLAAKARAIGIHLIVATQRPSTNVITGVIKANFPSRIAFKVTNYIDSKTILDQTGANQLIGRGDLLISYGGEITRVQCAFIDTPEVQSLVDFISEQQGYPCVYELPEVKTEGGEDGGGAATLDPNNRDPLFDEAARLICSTQQGSTSMLQRKFSIGYNRAGKIIDQLEAAGIVGPYEGSKARQVLYDETSLERYLEVLHGIN